MRSEDDLAVVKPKKKTPEGVVKMGGRGREARTPDLLIWNQLLYQLSYTPKAAQEV